MGELALQGTMQGLAVKAATVIDRVYDHPVGNITPPCAIIGYPVRIDFDVTMGRGSDKAVFPVWHIAGAQDDAATFAALDAVVSGALDLKAALDGKISDELGGSCRTITAEPETISVNGVAHIALRFDVEVYS